MGSLVYWTDRYDSQCVCSNCTTQVQEELSFFPGELCPNCNQVELEESSIFDGWVFCQDCEIFMPNRADSPPVASPNPPKLPK